MQAGAGLRGARGARNEWLIAAVVAGAVRIGAAVGYGSHIQLSSNASPDGAQIQMPPLGGAAIWAAGASPAPAIDTPRDESATCLLARGPEHRGSGDE
jgi:hypothetical protein